MLDRVFPSPADFTYRGSKIALWLLGLILLVKIAIALGAIFNGHYAATIADGIPVDSYSPEAAKAFLSLFASLGLAQLMLGVVGAIVLLRYRALVPLFLLLLIVEYFARKGVAAFMPIVRSAQASGSAINWVIFGVMVLAFVLSLRGTRVGTSPEP